MATYSIEVVTVEEFCGYKSVHPDIEAYVDSIKDELSAMFGHKFDPANCNIAELAERCVFLVGVRNGKICGHMIAYFFDSPFDRKVKIFRQLSFYVKPDSGRTAYHLFHKFIDIGRKNANHVITMRTAHTNIKPETFKQLGFKELETLYRLEIT